jgi:hypothetical protein
MTIAFGSGAPARDAEGRRPSEPGMTELSSDRLQGKVQSRSRRPRRRHAHVTEQVFRDDDAVQLSRVGDHDHRGGVHQMMVERQLRVLLFHQGRHGLPPETGRGQDVGLVDRVDGQGWVRCQCALGGDTGDAFDFRDRVRGRVGRDSVFPGFDAVTKVYIDRQRSNPVK